MGSCCSNINSVDEVEAGKNKKRQLPKMKNPKKENDKQDFLVKLNKIIDKFKMINPSFEVKKFSLAQFWNLMKNYLNLNNSNYILLNSTNNDYFTHIQNKIDHVNDIINTSKYQDEIVLDSLRKYLDLKNLIVISNDKSLNHLEKLLDFFNNNRFRCLSYLLDEDINNSVINMNLSMFNLIHSSSLEKLPYCAISYNKFKNIQSNGYFFIDFSSKFLKKQQSLNKEEKSLFNNYLKDLNVNLVIQIFDEDSETHPIDFKKEGMTFTSLNFVKNLGNFIEKRNEFDKISDSVKKLLGYSEKEVDTLNKLKNNSVLLIFDKDVESEVQIYVLFLFFYKIFSIEPDKIKKYMMNNMNYIKDIKTYLQNNYINIISFLEKNYNYLRKEKINHNLLSNKDPLKDLIYIKDKFDYHLKLLKSQLDQHSFSKCIELIDKIITNIINNPKEEKYYRIKTSSEVFNKYVLSYENSVKILELFGFTLVNINEVDYYKINEEININYLKGLNFDFKEVLKKLE